MENEDYWRLSTTSHQETPDVGNPRIRRPRCRLLLRVSQTFDVPDIEHVLVDRGVIGRGLGIRSYDSQRPEFAALRCRDFG